VPRKNVKLLGGMPLVAWSIEEAKKARSLNSFLVSTDDEEIAEISRSYGAPVPFMRPAELGKDVDSTLVLQHAIDWFETNKKQRVGHIVMLQCSSPFRQAHDIDECVRIAQTTGVDSVISFRRVTEHPEWMFEMKPYSHEVVPFMDVDLEGDTLVSQNLPFRLYPNGAVYVVKRDVVMNEGRIFGNKTYAYIMPHERSIDLEEETDFIIASAFIPQIKKDEPYVQLSWVIA